MYAMDTKAGDVKKGKKRQQQNSLSGVGCRRREKWLAAVRHLFLFYLVFASSVSAVPLINKWKT
jgi:hypothetical protein